MKVLNREGILTAADIVTEDVPCPEFGPDCVVRIRNLTAAGRAAFIQRSQNQRESGANPLDFEVTIVVMTAVDEHNVLCFKEEDAPLLAEKSAVAIKRLSEVAQRLSGLLTETVKETAKNS